MPLGCKERFIRRVIALRFPAGQVAEDLAVALPAVRLSCNSSSWLQAETPRLFAVKFYLFDRCRVQAFTCLRINATRSLLIRHLSRFQQNLKATTLKVALTRVMPLGWESDSSGRRSPLHFFWQVAEGLVWHHRVGLVQICSDWKLLTCLHVKLDGAINEVFVEKDKWPRSWRFALADFQRKQLSWRQWAFCGAVHQPFTPFTPPASVPGITTQVPPELYATDSRLKHCNPFARMV